MAKRKDDPTRLDPERVTRKLVCVGLVQTKASKRLTPDFAEVDEEGNVVDGATYCWAGLRATVGHVYTIETTSWVEKSRVVLPSTLRYVAPYWETRKRLAWESEANALRARLDAEKARKLAEKKTALREAVAPLAGHYHSLISSADRRAFLVMVVEEIVNPRAPKET